MPLVLRLNKLSSLTFTELDGNFTYLNGLIGTNTSNIATNTANISTNTTDITNLEGSRVTTSSYNAFTGSVLTTLSFNSFTSSIVTTSSFNAFTSSVVTTSSFNAFTASVITTGSSTANQSITGSLIISGSGLIVSGAIYVQNLTSASQTFVVTYNTSSGQLYYTASSAIQTTPTPSYLIYSGSVTASVNVGTGNVFTVASGSTPITLLTLKENQLIITGSTANQSTLISSSGVFLSRTSDGTYVSNITANGNMFYNTRNTHQFKNNAVNSLWIFESGNVQIATQAGDLEDTSGFKLYINGSSASGSFNANNILTVSGSNVTISGSLNTTGSVFFRGLTTSTQVNVVTVDTASGQLYYTASSAIGGGSTNLSSLIFSGSVTASVNVTGSSIFQITSGSSTFMIINNTGSVGIGTTTPSVYSTFSGSAALHIKSRVTIFEGEGTGSAGTLFTNNGGRTFITMDSSDFVAYTDNQGKLPQKWLHVSNGFYNNPPLLRLDGNLSVIPVWSFNYSGSSNPDYRGVVNVRGDANYNFATAIYTRTNTVSQWNKENGDGYYSGSLFIGSGSIDKGYKLMVTGSGVSGSLNINNTIYVSGSNSIDTGSNVGIGVINPQTRLDVTGSFRVSGGSGQGQLTVFGNDAVYIGGVVTNSRLVMQAGPNSNSNMWFYYNNTYTGEIGTNGAGGRLIINPVSESVFLTNGQERMRLNKEGNLQISASSPNTDSGYKVFIDKPGPSGSLNVSNIIYVSGSTVTISGSLSVVSGSTEFQVLGTGIRMGNSSSDAHIMTGSFRILGTGNTGSILTIIGSGSLNPVFTIQGSQGELFSVTDSLSGSLFSVNDISGLPILDVNSDQTTKIGSYLAPGMYASTKVTANTGVTVVYSVPTASYDSAYFDYNIRSGSVGRAGNIIAMWSGSSVNYSEVSASSFGTTSTFVFGVQISGSNMILSGSAPSNGWTVKTIVKAI